MYSFLYSTKGRKSLYNVNKDEMINCTINLLMDKCPDCLNTESLPKYDPVLQEFVWFEDVSIDQQTTNLTHKVLLRRKLINNLQDVQKTILRLKKRKPRTGYRDCFFCLSL